MQTEPEQWAVEWHKVALIAQDHEDPCLNMALGTLYSAFEERERKLREALKRLTDERTLQTTIPGGPWTPEVVAEFQSKEVGLMRDLAAAALKETPDAH